MPCIAVTELVEPFSELKNRTKFEPTSTARPAAPDASIAVTDVIPLLPSGVSQSFRCMIRIGLTSHQIPPVLTKLSSTTGYGSASEQTTGGSADQEYRAFREQDRKIDRRRVHGATSGYRIVRVGTLCLDIRLGLPGFGNVAE